MKFTTDAAVAFTYFKTKLYWHCIGAGIDVYGTECQRTFARQQKLFMENRTPTLDSDHLVCCAEDIYVVEGGRTVEDGEHPSYAIMAEFWKSLNPGCYHLGPRDACHFGYRPKEGA